MTFTKIRRLKRDMVKIFLEEQEVNEKLQNLIEQADEEYLNSSREMEESKTIEKYFGADEIEEKKVFSYIEVYTLSVAWILFETLI